MYFEIDEDHTNEKKNNHYHDCPCHEVFNQGLRSLGIYQFDCEFGSCHRYEASGTLHGLMRLEVLLKMTVIYFVQKIKSKKRQNSLSNSCQIFTQLWDLIILRSSYQHDQR